MSEFVLDINVIFSAVISGKQFYREILFNSRFYLPDFALDELRKYEEILLRETNIPTDNLKEYILLIFENLIVVPQILLSDSNIMKAFNFCRETDGQDTLYVALSLELNIPLITRDKALYKGLKKAGFDNIIMFDEICREKSDSD